MASEEVDGQIKNSDSRCPTGTLPDSDKLGHGATRLIAGPNAGYLIHDVVDGIVAPWYQAIKQGSTEWDPCDVPVAPIDASIPTYQAVLRSAVKALGHPDVIALLQGLVAEGVEYDLGVLNAQIEAAVGIVEGVGLFDMANGVQLLDSHEGVFAERPPGLVGRKTVSHVAHWPGRQKGLSGWYQKWTKPPTGPPSDRVQIDITDNGNGILQWGVTDASGNSLVGTDWEKGDPIYVSTKNGIILEVDLIGEVADTTATVTFDVTPLKGGLLGGGF